jgi:AcrR family transcriptional regulator
MAAPTRNAAGRVRVSRRGRTSGWAPTSPRVAPTSPRVATTVGTEPQSARVAELQRARLLSAAVAAFDELGYVDTAVADVTGRARVSRRTFYEQFANSDECLAAVLDDAVASVERELAATGASLAGRPWRERVRAGLLRILALLDRDPALARVCMVQAARGGPLLVERRERALARLAAAVDEGRAERARGVSPTPLTAEGVVGAALSIVHARVARRNPGPLTGLLNELMSMIVLPYRGAAAARRELERPALAPQTDGAASPVTEDARAGDALRGVPMRLTYRTTRVLEGVAALPGASNREVAERAGIQDPGQISKLLMRLKRIGLLTNASAGHAKGEPNAWRLTPLGDRVVTQLRHTGFANTDNACVAPGSAFTHDNEEEK